MKSASAESSIETSAGDAVLVAAATAAGVQIEAERSSALHVVSSHASSGGGETALAPPVASNQAPVQANAAIEEDIHDPVVAFQRTLKNEHAQNTASFFEELVRRSGVDAEENAATVKELRALEEKVKADNSRSMWWRVLRGVILSIGIICVIVAISQPAGIVGLIIGIVGAIASGLVVFLKLNPLIKSINHGLAAQKKALDAKLAQAWGQMASLNDLYDWDILAKLLHQTVPRIGLDPYFSNGRLKELQESFGWNGSLTKDSSVIFAHSGTINGNPFVISHILNHWMGSKTYHGSLTISWTEVVRDSNGNLQSVTRTQTLNASVTKPFPKYGERKAVVYGNEAAPNLSFSREPSNLSGLGDGALSTWRKDRAVKKLEAKTRNLAKGNGFTVMANREFDALFGAVDRDHEVQFRLLFTPLAQQEMTKLLKDKEVGYGDDFWFTKACMINMVEPAHMRETDISADPAKFQSYELDQARAVFNQYHNDLFRSLFFGFAPLLTIPLYQQHRSHQDIYRDAYGHRSCAWEHESLANYFGEEQFQHPDCITRSVLKTRAHMGDDGAQVVHVAAFGHSGIDRVDYVSVYGGDGRYHEVPVEWVEYVPVQNDSEMVVRESLPADEAKGSVGSGPLWHGSFQKRGIDPRNAVLRRSIYAAVKTN